METTGLAGHEKLLREREGTGSLADGTGSLACWRVLRSRCGRIFCAVHDLRPPTQIQNCNGGGHLKVKNTRYIDIIEHIGKHTLFRLK